MKIKLSRHAKRRAKLYNIKEKIILDVLQTYPLKAGKNEILVKPETMHFPLKIVFILENDEVTVITIYPLKKAK